MPASLLPAPRTLICPGPEATTSRTPWYSRMRPVTQTDLSGQVFSGSPNFARSLPSGKISPGAGMAEETEETEEPEDVCALCSRILAPDDFVVPYGNGLAHWECVEREDRK